MQNKGLVKLFAILFGLVSIYQLSFTFLANKVEKEAAAYAKNRVELNDKLDQNEVAQFYLDSIGKNDIMMGINYNEARNNKLNLGLDLKGGVNVILQIAVKDILRGLTNNTEDVVFNKALAEADELQKNAQETYLESFLQAFEKVNAESGNSSSLSSPNVFATRTLEADGITKDASDAKVAAVLKDKINEAVESSIKVLTERIDQFGVVQPNITRLGKDSGRILIELPGAKDEERILDIVSKTAQLEFWETYTLQEMAPFLADLNSKLREKLNAQNNPVEEKSADSTATNQDDASELLGGEKARRF